MTRGQKNIVLLGHKAGTLPIGLPTPVKIIHDATVQLLLVISLTLVHVALAPATFWAYVCSLGEEWIWDGIVNEGEDII